MTAQQALNLAIEHLQSGRLADAQSICRQILAVQPENPDALHLLGFIAGNAGQTSAAIELIGRAIAINGQIPDYHNNLGLILSAAGRTQDALAAFDAALRLNPAYPEAHNNRGLALLVLGRTDDAAAAFQAAIRLKPNYARALSNLAVAFTIQRRPEAAVDACRSAIRLDPRLADAYVRLSVALSDLEQFEEAIAAGRKAIELAPHDADASKKLGMLLQSRQRPDEAEAAYRQAIRSKPNDGEAWGRLAGMLAEQGRLDEAIDCYRRAIDLNPADARIHGELLCILQFHPRLDAAARASEHQRWAHRHADPLIAQIRPHLNDRSPDRRLRVGYVSPDFRMHPIGRLLEALFAHHDHAQFEVFCYSDARKPDAVTARLKPHFDVWRDTADLNDEALAELIRQDQIDILIDLNLHLTGSRMLTFARKPAPVQASYVGIPAGTGLPTMDYRLTDRYMDPQEGSGFRVQGSGANTALSQNPEPRTLNPSANPSDPERLAYLPGCYWCYTAPDDSPEVNELPALRTEHITFGSFNNFIKVNDDVIALWSAVLQALPQSQLHLLISGGRVNAHVYPAFARHGITQDRIILLPRRPHAEYLRLHHDVDIILDPFPYNGHTTSMDALWMGVPVVTLAGDRALARAGITLLTHVGLPELIAQTPQQYVQIATNLADDLPRLAELRRTLRPRMRASVLMDAPRFARGFEDVYRQMWNAWTTAS